MKRMQTGRWVLTALLLTAGGTMGWAEDLAIQSFDATGRLTFNEVSTAETYRVEWAPSPNGPWTNFTGEAGAALDAIAPTGSGIVTCSVPMVYRVVATMPRYLVVDLTGSTNYPVTYLDAVPPGGWTDEYKTTKLVLRHILATAGTGMGSPSNEVGRSFPEIQHTVTLTDEFYIGVFEVTQRQWELVMGNKPSYFTNATYYQTRPVDQVTYHEVRENPANSAINPNWPASSQVHADSFMGKLRAKTGLTKFDLPTEAQWEYACRAGTTTALNSGHNLTNDLSDSHMDVVGRYLRNGGSGASQNSTPVNGTAAVGSYPPNAWGLYDMHGNVLEWCLDWFGRYPETVTDPAGASSGSYRIKRGGSWHSYAGACRSAYRDSEYPDDRDSEGDFGFRVCYTSADQP